MDAIKPFCKSLGSVDPLFLNVKDKQAGNWELKENWCLATKMCNNDAVNA